MTKLRKFSMLPVMLMLPTLIGCTDKLKAKDDQISLIEDTNQRLIDELAGARRENEILRQDRNDLEGRVMSFQGEISDLNMRLAAKPEPAAAPDGWQAVPGGAMIAIEGSVLFPSGKASLRDAGKRSLDDIAAAIRSRYPDKDIFVFGHTDDTPIKKSGWTDNLELSTQRALSVVRHLQQKGLSPSKLVACGAGEHRPRMPNTNNAARAKNRRVEIFAVDPID